MPCRFPATNSYSSHLFGGSPKPGCSDRLRVGIIESHNFFVLRPIWEKFHIQTWLIERFPSTFQFWCCAEKKLHFTPFHTLRQLKHDEALFPPLGRVVEFPAGYHQTSCHQFLGVGKIWRLCDLRSRSYKCLCTHTHTHTHTHTRTQSD